jgi:hypothetical protein
MSKGAFNFNTQAVSSFELARSQQYRSEAEFVYYNAQIINNTTDTVSNQKDPAIEYIDTRIRPVVSKVSDYTVSVENFTIDGAGKNLPLFIPQIRQYKGNSKTIKNRNPNDTIYDITFTWTSGGTQVIQSTRSVQWEPENLAPWASQPLPYGEYTGPQPEIPYYYCYTYSHWLKLVNAALACAWEDVKLAAMTKYPSVDFGTKCPFYTYDKVTNLFSLWQDSNTCVTPYGSAVSTAPFSPTNAPNPLDVFGPSNAEGYSEGEFSFVGYNTNFEGLFTNFSTKYYGSGTPLSSSGIVLSNPLGNEPCGVLTNPEVDTVGVSGYDGTAMTVTWDASPNPVSSSSWVFELPLESTSSVKPIAGGSATFTLTGNPVAQYLYSPLKIQGRSYGSTGAQTSYFQGTISSYTQSTGALVINSLAAVSPAGVTGTNWKFELGPLTSSTSVKPIDGEPLTLAVNLDPTQSLVYEGTAIDLIGSLGGSVNQTVSGNVLSYEMSFGYNSYTNPDPQIDGFKYTTSSGPTGKFNPYVVFKAQDGTFQPGDYVEGSQTQATGKVIRVLAGNTNLPNTININNLNGSFKIGDLVGLTGGAVSGLGTIVDISGPNEGSPDVQPMVKLTFSGQKNPFKINDLVYTASGAQGRITDIIGPNTGYARIAITEQDGQFGPREYLVNTSEANPLNIGGGEIIKVDGDNTGYATATYINSKQGGAPSKFIANEFLVYASGGQLVTFAQVVIDNTDATDAYGNQGNVTIKLLPPNGTNVYPPPSSGTQITGSQSNTTAEYGGISFLGTGVITLGNINGTSFLTGDRIINLSGDYVSTALVSGFNYIDGGQLIVEVLQGAFRLDDIIYGASSNSPELFDLDQVNNSDYWDRGNALTWPGGAGTVFENQGLFNGASYILVNNIQGSYPVQGTKITNNNVTANLLTLTGLTGGFSIGESIRGPTGSASVSYISPDKTIVGLESVTGTFRPNDIVQGSTGLSVPYTFGSLEMCILQSGSQGAGDFPPAVTVSTINASFSLNQVVKIQTNDNVFRYTTFYNGTIAEVDNYNMILNPYTVGATFDSAKSSVYLYPPSFNNSSRIRYLAGLQGEITPGDKIVCENGAFGFADCVGTEVNGDNRSSWSVRLFINCGGPPFQEKKPNSSDQYTLLNESTGKYIRWGGRSNFFQSNYCLRARVQTPVNINNTAKVVTYAPNTPSTGLFFASSNSQPNAQVQTVLVDDPPNIQDTVLTVQNIVGDFPIGSEIIDLGTGSGGQITQTAFQNGSMIVQPLNGTFSRSDRMVGPDGSANFYEQLQQTLSGVSGSTLGTAAIKEDSGTYLTLTNVDGNFATGGTFTITSPAGSAYAGVTGRITQIPNFIVGKEVWGRGDSGGPDYAPAIVISDTGSAGSTGILTLGNVQTLNGIGWQGANYVAQYWNGSTGSAAQATINTSKYGFNLTMLPNSTGITGNSWQIKPTTLTSSSLATPSVGGQSVLDMNLNNNEVVFYPGDTLKVTEYTPILPVGTIFYPENVVQVDLSAGNGVVETLKSIFPSSPDTGATYVVLVQDYESTSTLWSPVASIVVATTFIPVREEYSGQPIILGTANNGTQGNATTASFQKDLIETPIDDIRPQVGYRGMLKYQKRVPTFTSLSLSNDDLKNLDIGMYWRNRLTNKLIPLTLFNGGSTNVRLMFKKIYE